MSTEWIDRDVQGRRRLCLVVDEEEWNVISQVTVEFWDRLFSELEGTKWSAMYIAMQPDYGFNFYLHTKPAAWIPSGNMIDGPRFELEFTRMEQDFDRPNYEHAALRESAWEALERALAAPTVLQRYQDLRAAGCSIRGGEWDAKDGYPREVTPRI